MKEPEQECPEGMVYKECGTACPTTCDNKDEVIICTEECVAGRCWILYHTLQGRTQEFTKGGSGGLHVQSLWRNFYNYAH